MIVYVPTSGSSVAQALTQALWRLTRPPQVQQPTDVTRSLFGAITCLDGSVWLQVNTEYSIPVHPDAELDGIADIMQPWIDAGALPADTNDQLATLINTTKGQRLVVWDGFPQLFKDQSKTREELIAAGLLPPPPA